MLDEQLLQILVCPNCKGTVEYRVEKERIACLGECKYEYPVVEGIPHMLLDEAFKP